MYDHFWSDDLDLELMILIHELDLDVWRSTCKPKMNFVGQGFQKVRVRTGQTDTITDTQTDMTERINWRHYQCIGWWQNHSLTLCNITYITKWITSFEAVSKCWRPKKHSSTVRVVTAKHNWLNNCATVFRIQRRHTTFSVELCTVWFSLTKTKTKKWWKRKRN